MSDHENRNRIFDLAFLVVVCIAIVATLVGWYYSQDRARSPAETQSPAGMSRQFTMDLDE